MCHFAFPAFSHETLNFIPFPVICKTEEKTDETISEERRDPFFPAPADRKPWESFSSAMLRSLIRPSPLLSFFSGEAASLFLFFPIPLFLTLPDLPRDSYPGRRLFLLASSPEFVGEIRFREFAKLVI